MKLPKKLTESENRKILSELKSVGNLPVHVAIIMDGNGRWAKKRGLPRVAGHNEGVKSVREVVEAAGEAGVAILTLYTFSHENWKRPSWEVSALMKLLMRTIHSELDNLNEKNVQVRTIGHIELLPPETLKQVQEAVDQTQNNTGLILNLALSYGSRIEIMDAVKRFTDDVSRGRCSSDELDENLFADYLYTAGMPDPDLVVRTSGEFRISNFLLWQMAYSEIYVTDTLWPDFRKAHFYEALRNYQKRERRFGKVSEQVQKEKSLISVGKFKRAGKLLLAK